MEKFRFIVADALTFGAIAVVAALFAHADTGIVAVTVLSRIICAVSLLLMGLAVTVKRPEPF